MKNKNILFLICGITLATSASMVYPSDPTVTRDEENALNARINAQTNDIRNNYYSGRNVTVTMRNQLFNRRVNGVIIGRDHGDSIKVRLSNGGTIRSFRRDAITLR